MHVTEPVGTMIVDIGGGTTEVAVLSLGGTVVSESLRIAGDEINESIVSYLKKSHNMVVGERTAEKLKIKIGSAFPNDNFDLSSFEVRGLHLLSGLPRSISLNAGEVREAMAEPLSKIIDAIKRTLERTPPELAADIVERGIMLAGGGALVRGMNDLVTKETGILTHVAEDPLLCVVNGCGEILDDLIYCIPMIAPYKTIINYKYSVKCKPGNQKNKKIARNIINKFKKNRLSLKEKFLIKNISYDYLCSVIRSNIHLIK